MPKKIRELKSLLLRSGFTYKSAKARSMKYTILIQWSNEDECYVVSLPDFPDIMQPCTDGDTYEEALKNAQEVLEMLIESYLEDGQPLPDPQTLDKSLKVA